MYASATRLTNITDGDAAFNHIGFVLLLIDFCVSGIPIRLLNFMQPLGFSLFYNLVLLVFSFVTRRKGPFYRVADYFSHDNTVSFYHFVRHTVDWEFVNLWS